MLMVKIDNIGTENSPEGQAYRELLDGKTYMDFKVRFCPAYGSVDVMVSSEYDTTAEEFKDFVLFFLAGQAMRAVRVIPPTVLDPDEVEDDEDRCTSGVGHKFEIQDSELFTDGICRCLYCGADGDA